MALAESPAGDRPPLDREAPSATLANRIAWWPIALVALACAIAGVVVTQPKPDVRAWERSSEVSTLSSAARMIWAGEPSSDSLLRLDPATGRVTSQLAVGSQARAVDQRLWVLDKTRHRLTVADPASGRVTKRVALVTPEGEPYKGFDAFPSGGAVWVTDPLGALLLDRATLTSRKRVDVSNDGIEASMWAPAGTAVWTVRGDGGVDRFDGSSGHRTLRVPSVLSGTSLRLLADERGVAVLAADGSIAALDAHTGRVMWRARLPQPLGAAAFAGDRLVVQSPHPTEPHDRLTTLSRADGHRLATADMPLIGSTSMTVHASRIWVSAPGGRLVSAHLDR